MNKKKIEFAQDNKDLFMKRKQSTPQNEAIE